MKQIITGILDILDRREKIKLYKLILFDLVIGVLDISFLGLLLVVINFYTKNIVLPKISLIPPALLNQNSFLKISAEGRKTFWRNISYVKQQPFFINDSILKNITLDDNSYNRERMNEVIDLCGINQFLDRYPEGL